MVSIKRILYPTDFTDRSAKAFEYALSFAINFNIDVLYLLFVADIAQSKFVGEISQLKWEELEEILEKEAKKQFSKFLSMIPEEYKDNFKIEKIIKKGLPHREIVKAAKDYNVDLIIMATQGEESDSPLGSIAEKVVKTASCPVLTIRVT